MHPIIVWFRRDLRTEDHTALLHASRTGLPLVPLFVFDRPLIDRLPSDGAAFDFQAAALRELDAGVAALGGRLIVRHGDSLEVHRRLIAECAPAALYHNRDYEPSARARDAAVERLYRSHGVEVKTFKDHLLHEPDEVLTPDGRPYVVFTPFANTWKKLPLPLPEGKPRPFRTPSLPSDPIAGAKELGRGVLIPEPAFEGGASHAVKRWKTFLRRSAAGYATGRDLPGTDGTSRMSAHLRFGCISIRRMAEDCRALAAGLPPEGAASVRKYVDELIWREFYQAVLWHHPRLVESNYREEFDRLPWRREERLFTAWREGRTGFPLVDAGMRELNRTGWMHNRVRMVVASFLTKDLMHDWKLGEKVFEEKLLDIETASNNGGWQWSASTGVDPRPLRIFNPRLQAERYDPEGTYIRRHVPELRDVPARWIHAPHEMPRAAQQEARCLIGVHYPAPIVDHAAASAAYKHAFADVKRARGPS